MNRCKIGVSLVIALVSAAAFALPPGGRAKKHIGLVFDVMGTSPTNILANADKFAKYAPYLDGVAISLNNVELVGEGGSVITTGLTSVMSGTVRWTRDAVKEHIPVLREIVKKPHLTESFLLFWMMPQYCDTRLDWADDKAWANYAENMATVAWLAKEGGLKGLMLDPEEYANADQYNHTPADPPYDECAKLARQRGREVFSRVFKEYPDAVIFTLWYFGCFRGYTDGINRTNPVAYAEDMGRLLHHFYNGMLDVMPPKARVVDGCEHYSLSATRYQYLFNANSVSTGVLPFVAPENIDKYRSQMLVSNTLFLDMYAQDANPKSHWYHGPVNGSRLEHLRLNFERSLLTATEYVWIYAENHGKLFDWGNGYWEKKKTWEEAIPGMTETLMLVKDPERWAAEQRSKLKAEGKLVNLVPDVKPVKLENPKAIRKLSMGDSKTPLIKNIRPGERYLVDVAVHVTYGRRGKEGRVGAACPRIVWRKGGKRLDIPPTPIEVPAEAAKRMVRAEAVVTVPEGADEMLFDLAAEINANECVSYIGPAIRNALDPVSVENKTPQQKWVIDTKKRTLTDGNWTITVFWHKGRMFARGTGKNTPGKGVLDLRNVKADTGYQIDWIGQFYGHKGITAIYIPQGASIEARAFKDCTNLQAAIFPDTGVKEKDGSYNKFRRAQLGQLGVGKELGDGKLRHTYKHPSSVSKGFGLDIAAENVKPGELYNLKVSMRRQGAGRVYLYTRFRNEKGRFVGPKRTLNMSSARQDGVWREAEAIMRAPEGAVKVCFDISANLNEGSDVFEFDNFRIYKIGDPLPVWPPEAELEKGSSRK